MFLDDGLAGDKDFATALQCSKQVKLQLEDLGFLIAHEKSHWFPCQKLDWLGFTWDTKNVGAKISTVTVNTLFDCEIFCDASDVGFGGYITPFAESHFENFETFGNWTKSEMGESSTWRELECVRRVLNKFKNVTENKQIIINSDNKNVEHILKVGSKKLKLQSIATSIIDFCEVQKINLTPNWIPRTENNDADYLSRVMDHDDWGIETSIYHYLCNLWDICTVDRFATHYNSQCERFNSKVWCPGTEAVDAFTQFWGNDVNWLVPPPILITKTLNKLKQDNAKGTLIVPEWTSAPYWPILHRDGEFRFCEKYLLFTTE
ncbi:Hypothetical predicted protein [Mytilus galloprovincialis]|uniref:Reverse transcriptase RNase H-like domain-containing protein n=1 Tax=Mytilus galloprovincialis TaxID=29158 RepID=A0A8B6G5Y2_MYTGA|nr:Hypothetical predicted protein [Mytilus galloprovincialis]